jgi:hypothetical protein
MERLEADSGDDPATVTGAGAAAGRRISEARDRGRALVHLLVEGAHAPADPRLYARLAHLLGPWMTAQWKRPAPNGVMTRRPREASCERPDNGWTAYPVDSASCHCWQVVGPR